MKPVGILVVAAALDVDMRRSSAAYHERVLALKIVSQEVLNRDPVTAFLFIPAEVRDRDLVGDVVVQVIIQGRQP